MLSQRYVSSLWIFERKNIEKRARRLHTTVLFQCLSSSAPPLRCPSLVSLTPLSLSAMRSPLFLLCAAAALALASLCTVADASKLACGVCEALVDEVRRSTG